MILPHGVLFRGNAEARIRENLIKQGYIKGIIGLPANLFYGTGIPACVLLPCSFQANVMPCGSTSSASKFASPGGVADSRKGQLR